MLDACWSGSMIGDKVRNKIIERINRANKMRRSQHGSGTGRAKTPNRTAPSIRNRNENEISKVVVMIKEENSPEYSMLHAPINKSINLSSSIKFSPHKSIAQSSFASTFLGDFNGSSSHAPSRESYNASEVTAFQPGIELVQSDVQLTSNTPLMTLKNQINICTKGESRAKRKRRGRKERGKLDITTENAINITNENNVTMSIQNRKILDEDSNKLNESILSNISNNIIDVGKNRAKSGVRKSLVPNVNKKPCTKTCSTKQVQKSAMKSSKYQTKKEVNSKRYIARKYLGELYDKVIFRVREIERNRKLSGHSFNYKINLDKSIKLTTLSKNRYTNGRSNNNPDRTFNTTEIVAIH